MKKFKNSFGLAHHALLGLVVVAIIVAAGVRVLTWTHALVPPPGGGLTQTQTEYFNGASSIIPSPYSVGYSIVNDYLGNEPVKVALVNAGGHIEFGGKGGGSAGTPVAQQFCYVMKSPNGAKVSVQGLNGGLVALTVKPWPYQAAPPYQHSCVTNGDTTRQAINFKVVSGGPVYFYGQEYLETYPY